MMLLHLFIVTDCLRVMEKKSNVVIKPSTSTGDATQDEEGVAIATPISVESEVPLSEQGGFIVMELCSYTSCIVFTYERSRHNKMYVHVYIQSK